MNDFVTPSNSEYLEAPPPPRPPQNMFMGPNGLRAGWGLLQFVLFMGSVFAIVSGVTVVMHMHNPPPVVIPGTWFTPVHELVVIALYLVSIILSAVMLARISRFRPAGGPLVLVFMAIAIAMLAMLIVHVRQVGQAKAQAKAAMAASATSGPTTANNKDAGKQPTPAQGKPGDAITAEMVSFAVVLLFTWLMSCIEARRFGLYGLGSSDPQRMMHLVQGLITGFVALSLLVLVLYLGHWITFGGFLLHGAHAILVNGFLWFIAFVFVGFFEEFTFRGYIQYTLARGIGFGAIGFFIAAFIWNFGFGAVHGNNPGESPIGLVTAGLIGFIFCISLYYTGSLWWAIGFHATWDWAESYFYGTADSGGVSQGRLLDSHPHGANIFLTGGTTGPEGSVFCIIIALLVGVFIFMTQRPRDGRPRYPLAR